MTGQPDRQHRPEDASDQRSEEVLNPEGAGLGAGGANTTFEPEETPEAVDDRQDARQEAAEASGLDGVVEPREMVPDDDRADEVEALRQVLPDDERGVDDAGAESESERLLPDPERLVPGGPADDPA